MTAPTATRATTAVSARQRLANKLLARLIRRGKGPEFLWLLTVRGRHTGEAHTTPVAPVQDDGATWLVSTYGDVAWVRNVRANGHAELRRGIQRRTFRARELSSTEATSVLRAYLSMPSERFVRKDFAVTAASTDEQIAAESPRHPVFALTEIS